MTEAVSEVAPYDLPSMMARMLAVAVETMAEQQTPPKTETEESPQKWATRAQLAERLGMSVNSLDAYLCRAERSGEVSVLEPMDDFGRKGVKRYHIAEFERFFALRTQRRR